MSGAALPSLLDPDRVLFASDMHLDDRHPALVERFLTELAARLQATPASGSTLFLLGDLFEYWIGDDAVGPAAQRLAALLHGPGLESTIDDGAQHATGQALVGNVELVGKSVVEAQPLLQAFGEVGEATRNQHRLQAGSLGRRQQDLGARRQVQAFLVDPLDEVFTHAFQQRHATGEALGKVLDLAPHGGFGDGSDLSLQARHVGDLVQRLHGDQRGIHVDGQQPEIRQTQAVGHVGGIDPEALGPVIKDGRGLGLGAPACQVGRRVLDRRLLQLCADGVDGLGVQDRLFLDDDLFAGVVHERVRMSVVPMVHERTIFPFFLAAFLSDAVPASTDGAADGSAAALGSSACRMLRNVWMRSAVSLLATLMRRRS